MINKGRIVTVLGLSLFLLLTIMIANMQDHIAKKNDSNVYWTISSFKMTQYLNDDKSTAPFEIQADKAQALAQEQNKEQTIALTGNVLIQQLAANNKFTLHSDKALYDPNKNLFYADNIVSTIYYKDKPQIPLNITAKSLMLDRENNSANYQGSVVVTQETLQINADEMIIFLKKHNDVGEIHFHGNPVKYVDLNQKNPISGTAKTIEYNNETKDIILRHNAVINKNGDLIQGNYLVYNTAQQKLSNDNKNNARVKILIKSEKILNLK